MAYNVTECRRDQQYLLPPSIQDWLPEDHFVWLVLDGIEQMDVEHPNYEFWGASGVVGGVPGMNSLLTRLRCLLWSPVRWAHVQYVEAYSYYKVHKAGLLARSPLTHAEREFYLKLRPALQGDSLVVYDIGASKGVVSGRLAKLSNVIAVHAFEPIPNVYAQLVARMQPYPQVHCHNVAVGDIAG